MTAITVARLLAEGVTDVVGREAHVDEPHAAGCVLHGTVTRVADGAVDVTWDADFLPWSYAADEVVLDDQSLAEREISNARADAEWERAQG